MKASHGQFAAAGGGRPQRGDAGEALNNAHTDGPKRTCMTFDRITVDPHQMGGVPCIRGLRDSRIATVVGMVADRMTDDEIVEGLARP